MSERIDRRADVANQQGGQRLTKNEKREQAREEARIHREAQLKREKRNKIFLQGGIITGIVAVLAVIAIVIVVNVRPAGPGPVNMASGGFQVAGAELALTPSAAQKSGDEATPFPRTDDVMAIQIWADYMCPYCAAFEDANGAYIDSLVESGEATVEYIPMANLDTQSLGTKYSTRAANAVACVADQTPAATYDFHKALFSNQPSEGTAGLDNDEIVALAVASGADESVESCIRNQNFSEWVKQSTAASRNGPIAGSDVPGINATPTVLINGVQFEGGLSLEAFQAFVAQISSQTFVEETSSTPDPSATPEPSETAAP